MRQLANLCDQATADHTVEHALGHNDPSAIRQLLGERFARLLQGNFKNYSDLLLLSLCEDQLGLAAAELENLAAALQSNELSEEHIRQLRGLADILHRESASALSKMRSG
jgi:hypothetical protein